GDPDGAGAAGIRAPHGSRDEPRCAGKHRAPAGVNDARSAAPTATLTFDDGPNGAHTARLLDVLAAHRIPAVFCVVGEQVLAPGGAQLLRRIVADGHQLGAHGMGFADMGEWAQDAVRADIRATLAVIRGALADPTAP